MSERNSRGLIIEAKYVTVKDAVVVAEEETKPTAFIQGPPIFLSDIPKLNFIPELNIVPQLP